METYTKPTPYRTSDVSSFAFSTATRRWPVILTTIIDEVYRIVSESENDSKKQEGREAVLALTELKYQIQHNRPITAKFDDSVDARDYRARLADSPSLTWCNAPWLFAECFLYKRINMTFSKTQFWSEYDVFGRQKVEALKASRPAIIELAGRYKTIVQQLNKPARSPSTGSSNTEELLFREVCDICLWGNGSDLSILASLGPEQLQSRQGEEARKKAEKNVIVNQIRSAYSVLKEAQAKNPGERRVDIVLDNAGFELFVDLILASFLLTSNLATEVVLHTKTIPWFISDATEQDFWALLDALEFPRRFFETPTEDQKHNSIQPERLSDEEVTNMQVLSVSWNSFHENRTLAVQPTWFWTNYQDYRELPTHAKDIFEQFQQSELVIFKGDLNYRKLTGDLAWPVDTSFQMAIGDLGGPSNVRVLALRTCKADVVVGIPKSMDKHLRATTGKPDGPREWAWSGEWAVMQFFDGKEEARGAEERAQYSGNTDSDAAESVYG